MEFSTLKAPTKKRFVRKSIADAFSCPICDALMFGEHHEPTYCSRCLDNVNCLTCYTTMAMSETGCRCSCGAFVIRDTYKVCKPIIGQVQRSFVYCQNAKHGCAWKGRLDTQKRHLNQNCLPVRLQEAEQLSLRAKAEIEVLKQIVAGEQLARKQADVEMEALIADKDVEIEALKQTIAERDLGITTKDQEHVGKNQGLTAKHQWNARVRTSLQSLSNELGAPSVLLPMPPIDQLGSFGHPPPGIGGMGGTVMAMPMPRPSSVRPSSATTCRVHNEVDALPHCPCPGPRPSLAPTCRGHNEVDASYASASDASAEIVNAEETNVWEPSIDPEPERLRSLQRAVPRHRRRARSWRRDSRSRSPLGTAGLCGSTAAASTAERPHRIRPMVDIPCQYAKNPQLDECQQVAVCHGIFSSGKKWRALCNVCLDSFRNDRSWQVDLVQT